MSCFVTCESFVKGVWSRVFQQLLALYSNTRNRSKEGKNGVRKTKQNKAEHHQNFRRSKTSLVFSKALVWEAPTLQKGNLPQIKITIWKYCAKPKLYKKWWAFLKGRFKKCFWKERQFRMRMGGRVSWSCVCPVLRLFWFSLALRQKQVTPWLGFRMSWRWCEHNLLGQQGLLNFYSLL